MRHLRSHLGGSAFVAFGFAVANLLFCGIVGVCVLGVLVTLKRKSATAPS
jgi:hypothetical protein